MENLQKCGAFLLSSMELRDMSPMSLRSLHLENEASITIHDISATDIPSDVSTKLKALTTEIAECLINEFGIDPSGQIFSMGKTSSLVGFNLQALLPEVASRRFKMEDANFSLIEPIFLPKGWKNCGSLQPATLLLIDRDQDRFTPSCSSLEASLGHRILSTFPANSRRNLEISMLSVQQARLEHMCSRNPSHEDNDSGTSNLNFPLSGVSSLPLDLTPSLLLSKYYSSCPSEEPFALSKDEASRIEECVLCRSEEDSRAVLCGLLLRWIAEGSGKEPPRRKRGVGAEVLALVQSLLVAPWREEESVIKELGYNPRVALNRYVLPVLSLSVAVIEALQRSSVKQLATVCSWQCSYETKAQRDLELQQILLDGAQDKKLGTAFELLLNYLVSSDAPVDLYHVFLEAIRLCSIVGVATDSLSPTNNQRLLVTREINIFCQGFVAHCHYACSEEELRYLSANGLLSDLLVDDIICCRDAETSTEETQQELLRLKYQLNDLCETLSRSLQQVAWSRKRIENDDVSNFSVNISTQMPDGAKPMLGVAARALRHLFRCRRKEFLRENGAPVLPSFEQALSPLQQLKTAGLGLLSSGLGRLGLASTVSASAGRCPSDPSTWVVFVIGGVSLLEIQQIRNLVEAENNNVRVFIGSTRVVGPVEIMSDILRSA